MNDIRSISINNIREVLKTHNEPEYRAKQIWEWLWIKGVTSFNDMTNLSSKLRTILSNEFTFYNASTYKTIVSSDGTTKIIFKLFDNNYVEGVLIPSKNRTTACISSQVGCNVGCSFCATGKNGFKRNLLSGEIFDQIIILQALSEKETGSKLSNLVLMGMGEPLLNYETVMNVIRNSTSPAGLHISPRRITLSTIGIPHMIKKFADDKIPINLALSLHSANNNIRTMLIPINKTYSLEQLADAIKYYHQKTKMRITYEYVLIKGVNDKISDAQALANFCKISPCKINLIPFNTVEDVIYKPSDNKSIKEFYRYLEQKNMVVTLRQSKGGDINAACGQLAGKIT